MSFSRNRGSLCLPILTAAMLASMQVPSSAAPAACRGFKIVQSCTGGAPVTDTAACSYLSTNPDYQSCLSMHAPIFACASKAGNSQEYSSCLASYNPNSECYPLVANTAYQSCLALHTTSPPMTCSPVKVPCDYPDNIVDALSRIFAPAR